MVHWFLCVLVIIALVLVIRAWRDNKEKWHLWVSVLIIVIVLLVPCLLRIFNVAGVDTGGH
jgi:hypothetical protein